MIKGGKEVQKVVSYLAHEHSGACGNEITVGEHDCRDTTADHITARIEDEGDESEFDEYADAFERDADTIAYLNIEDLTEEHLMSGDFQIETDDGIDMLRKHIRKLMSQSAA
ncbi:hypothetical protein GL279_18865 [Paracoccus limosus]|uniref:Uncharacterized protein n=1 Tax=Paracoccus limosus TaxID=913252 RepID=A0A844HBH5_9RHOB|nr:hypothetical protein [Paracoccus limosus]